MKIEILGYFLKRIGGFSMKDFDSRLAFQKKVYFLQRFGIGLGYNFNWLIHGPYSPELASDGFQLESMKPKEVKVEFSDSSIEDNFMRFSAFLGKYKSNHMLELLASIDFLSRNGFSKEEVINMVKNKKEHFEVSEIKEGFKMLEQEGSLNVKS